MQGDNLVAYKNPGIALPVADALTEVLRRGAGTMLQQAVEAEWQKSSLVRSGHLPERRCGGRFLMVTGGQRPLSM